MFDKATLVRPLAFDLTRLLTRLRHSTPTGIDRVDLAYARWVLDTADVAGGVVSTAYGPRLLRPAAMQAIVDGALRRWTELDPPEADPRYRAVAQRLGLQSAGAVRPSSSADDPRALGLKAAALMRSRSIRALPPGTTYLHTSHLRLEQPRRFDWLAERPDLRAVFFVHDLIPVAFPEFSRPGEDRRHRARLETIARHGRAVIVNSADVGAALARHWADRDATPPIRVAPLGLEPIFTTADEGVPLGQVAPFFVMCGTIEPRKNHLMILQVWRRLAEGGGPVPKLVVAGRRGWESESVFDILERAPFAREHVIEAPGLSTPALARLMRLSRGVLMPSFAEGFGLPVAEALSLGTAVLASDIPVHREVAGAAATYLDPLDGPGWLAAIKRLAATSRATPVAGYCAPTWVDHFAIVSGVLTEVGR